MAFNDFETIHYSAHKLRENRYERRYHVNHMLSTTGWYVLRNRKLGNVARFFIRFNLNFSGAFGLRNSPIWDVNGTATIYTKDILVIYTDVQHTFWLGDKKNCLIYSYIYIYIYIKRYFERNTNLSN